MKPTLKLSIVVLLLTLIAFSFFYRSSINKIVSNKETGRSVAPHQQRLQAFKTEVVKAPVGSTVSSNTQSRNTANAPLSVVSKPLALQPTLDQISETTALPAKAAAEVRFDIPKMAELAKRREAFRLEILPGRFVTVYPANFHFENAFNHISGTVSSVEGADVTLTMDEGKVLVGIIQDPPRSYQIVYSGHKTSYVVEIDSSKHLPFYEKEIPYEPGILKNPANDKQDEVYLKIRDHKNGLDQIHQFVKNSLIKKSEFIAELFSSRAQAGYTLKDANKKIRMYMIYNSVVRNANGGDVGAQAMIANQVAVLNDSLANAGVKFRVEVSKYVYNSSPLFSRYDDKSYTLPADANYYTSFSSSSKSEAHKTVENLAQQFKNGSESHKDLLETKSDAVHLWVAYQNSDAVGRVRGVGDRWVANTPDGTSAASLSWNKPALGLWGYSFSAMQGNTLYAFAHEAGHLFGLEHNIDNSGYYDSRVRTITGLRFPGQYNFGYYDNVKKVKTLMSYESICGQVKLIDAKNELKGYTSTCPTLKSFSSGSLILGGLTANNKRKLLEFESTLFSIGIVELMASGQSTSGSYTPLKEALKSPKEIPVVVRADAKSVHLIAENRVAPPTRAYFVSPSLFSSYVRTFKNGGLINEASHAESSLAFSTSPNFKKGDKIEFRFENRFGYASARYVIADVHIPMSLAVTQNVGNFVKSGTKASFNASVTANPLPTCKWYINNVDTGVVAASLSIDLTTKFASEKKNVEYRCTRNSLYGANEFKVGSTVVTVMQVPTIKSSPANIMLTSNSTEVNLKVEASGEGLVYRWFKNGVTLANSNTKSLSLKGNVSTLTGQYFVRVNNPIGMAQSSTVSVSLFEAPRITLDVNEKINIIEGESLKLAATVNGNPVPRISWTLGNTPISSAALVIVPGINRSQAGIYSVSASNTHPQSMSVSTVTKKIIVDVLYKPEVKTGPTGVMMLRTGDPFNFKVEALGNPTPVYRWYYQNKNGTVSQTPYTSPIISIPAFEINHEGFYYCEISNSVGRIQTGKIELKLKRDGKSDGLSSESALSRLNLTEIKVKSSGGFWEAR